MSTARVPDISIVIPTRDRADLLAAMLDSLERQTLESHGFEVVVVDDGSLDSTPDLCLEKVRRGSIRYRRVASGGIAQAKNFGLLASRAPILLFLDDDDVAMPDLVERHLLVQRQRPQLNLAVLGFTTWHPKLVVTPVMSYVTDVAHLLFAYPHFDDGPMLPYHCFWGGRSSCKREFLLDHGIFDPEFRTIIEDVELAHRLRRAGLEVLFERKAVTYMARPITYDEFCERCERRGRALARFFELHPDAETEAIADMREATARWCDASAQLSEQVTEVRELEAAIRAGRRSLTEAQARLHALYAVTFKAFELKGIADGDGAAPGSTTEGRRPTEAGSAAL
jgi:GT2 family glycosyltransferase